jgi:hypothetical protein
MPHAFISYVKDDEKLIDKLVKELKENGINVWIDKELIYPGMNWKEAIRKAISEGSFFIACFSKAYEQRQKTYMNEELILAIEEYRKRSWNIAWFVPVLLTECKVPDISLGGGITLPDIQRV